MSESEPFFFSNQEPTPDNLRETDQRPDQHVQLMSFDLFLATNGIHLGELMTFEQFCAANTGESLTTEEKAKWDEGKGEAYGGYLYQENQLAREASQLYSNYVAHTFQQRSKLDAALTASSDPEAQDL